MCQTKPVNDNTKPVLEIGGFLARGGGAEVDVVWDNGTTSRRVPA
jgi:hypothetical protein